MSNPIPFTTSDGLSKLLITILNQAGIKTFKDLSHLTRLELKQAVPRLAVRHLSDLEHGLRKRSISFKDDDSIRLDQFINQRKLFLLWYKGIFTYEQLGELPFPEFVESMGGPQSRIFRDKKAKALWMKAHNIKTDKRYTLPFLTPQTAELLYKGGIENLKEIVSKTDFELAKILQPNFGTAGKMAEPFTRARLIEIKYALLKAGIVRPYTPL